jgi:hypothetical protein
MIYAARTADGQWTGATYEALTQAVIAHHAAYDETLEPLAWLSNEGTADQPQWVGHPATIEERRAAMVCSRFQARAALALAGLLDQAEAIVAQGDVIARLAWADAQEFRRTSPTILAMAGALGLAEEQIDALFEQAAAISA